MFDRPHVPLKVTDVSHSFEVQGDTEVPLIHVQLEMNPLTAEYAGEVSEFMRSTLFTRQDAEVNSQMLGASFNVVERKQRLEFRMAPDQTDESFVADEVAIGALSARRGKAPPAWKLVFTATWSPTGERQLAQVCDSLTKVRYVTFGDQQPNLVTEAAKAERTEKRRRATTH